MAEYFLQGFFVVMAVIGIAEVVWYIVELTLSQKNGSITFTIIPLQGHNEMVEFYVRNVVSDYQMKKNIKSCVVILLDNGMDVETKDICDALCQKYEFVRLCHETDIDRILLESKALLPL